MSTLAQDCFSEGFAALVSVHGEVWTFGVSTFSGVATVLEPNDPRMLGATTRILSLLVSTSDLPATKPRVGDLLVRNAKSYRITRALSSDLATGVTAILLADQ